MGGIGVNETVAYLGLGTNLGDRKANLKRACNLLSGYPGVRLLRCSQVYETEPWGVTEQPRFLNSAVEVATTLEPERLLDVCKDVEQQIGRQPGIRWGPRLIDLDILLYGNDVVDSPHLEIPHPRLHIRAFALIPLAELAPGAVHPGQGRTIGELARTVEGREGVLSVGGPG